MPTDRLRALDLGGVAPRIAEAVDILADLLERDPVEFYRTIGAIRVAGFRGIATGLQAAAHRARDARRHAARGYFA
jgi:hypothetical protein